MLDYDARIDLRRSRFPRFKRDSVTLLSLTGLLLLGATPIATADDWNATGGTVNDAAWSGDTPVIPGQISVGALEGEGGVNGGSATYSVPINVVPGRAGMQPDVSLNYSSSTGNGIAGVGWSLSAGASISRCGRTYAQDGTTDKVNFDKATDRLCMNGRRLVAVSGGYGNSGTEYRTEIDSYAKIVQTGDMDGTGTYFTVTYANGNRDFFGQTPDSRHSLDGITLTMSWVVNKSEDVSGNNTINYTYAPRGRGEHVLESIAYTGQGSAIGDRKVEFAYETRPDTSVAYFSGGLRESTQRLTSITTLYQTQVVRQYRLGYQQSATSSNSLVTTIEECGYSGTTEYCLPATTFDWYQHAPTYQLEPFEYFDSAGQPAPIGAPMATVTWLLPKKDMNGDGTRDWPSVFVNAEGEYTGPNNFENLGNCHQNGYTGQTLCHTADFNLDGLTDSWKLTSGTSRTFQYAYSNYDGSTPVLVSTPIVLSTLGFLDDEILAVTDLNGDGYADVLVRRAVDTINTYTGTSRVEVFLHTKNDAAPYTATAHFVYSIPARAKSHYDWVLDQQLEVLDDFDGNGIQDIFVFQADFAAEEHPEDEFFAPQFYKPRFRSVLLSQSSGTYSNTQVSFGENLVPGFPDHYPEYATHEMLFDLNGDGLLDLIGLVFNASFRYRINLGDGQLSEWQYLAGSQPIFDALRKGFVPVERSPATGGSGGPFGGGGPMIPDTYNEQRLVPAYVLDHDQNGKAEMLVPTNRLVSFCFDHNVMVGPGGAWGVQRFCDDEMYRVGETTVGGLWQPPLADMNDRSLYQYEKAVFTVTGYSPNGTPQITATLEPTSIVSTITLGARADVFGNGLDDFVTMASCFTTGTNCTYGDAAGNNTLADYLDSRGNPMIPGAYINRNVGSYGPTSADSRQYEIVDMMKSAEDALGARTEWDYLPLNSGRGGTDFYDADHSHMGTTVGYLHFSANVNVVHEVRRSNGLGTLNAFNYRYRDATLSSQGRGFQGFEQIIVEDEENELRSVSDYHVMFPLSGRLIETRQCLSSSADLECATGQIAESEYQWDLWRDGILRQTVVDGTSNYSTHVLENTSTDNRYWVSPRIEKTVAYETSSSQTAGQGAVQPITVGSLWTHSVESESQFNGNGCSTYRRETYEEPAGANKNEAITIRVYDPADTSTWWLCRTATETVQTAAVSGRSADYADIESGSDTATETRTTYTWDTSCRKPGVVTLEATLGGGQPARTTTAYNTHCLPDTVTVEGTAYNGAAYAMDDRSTGTTYTADGYFVATVTNAKGHITQTTPDFRFGLPTQITGPNGQITTMTYDPFGRLATSKLPGEPTVVTAYWWCSGVHGGTAWCPTGDYPTYRSRAQAVGSPDVYRYFDELDREVHSITRNFTNDDWYRDRRRYNTRGQLDWETVLYDNRVSGGARYIYYDGYDNLGRLTRVRRPQDNDTYSQTDYSYSGQTIDITAQSAGTGARTLYMARATNGLGQLIWTRDPYNSTTEYAYDGRGNPISLEDANDDRITTRFNALGQKEWVHDPNAGDRDFQYNSLGEVEWERDANLDITTYRYDVLGRIYDRWTNGVITGSWRYDSTAAWGRLGMIDYERNSSSTTDRLSKYYRYATTSGGRDYLSYTAHYIDENGAIPDENKHYTYYYVDSNYGRPTGMRYHTTGLTLQYSYNSTGYLEQVSNAASGYVYRQISDQDALGNVISSTMGDSMLTQTQSHHPASGQMLTNHVTLTSGGSTVHRLEYDYDGFSNLYQSEMTANNGLQNFETFTYDDLHRLTKSDRAYMSEGRPNDVIDYGYNSVGNITGKTDYAVGEMLYGNAARNAGGNAGPNAIRQITLASGGTANYSYDDNGNMLTGDGRTTTYNSFNKPVTITAGGVISSFSYGADTLRYRHEKTGLPGGTQVTFNIDRHFEVEEQGSRRTYRHYIDGVAVLNMEDDGGTVSWVLGFNLMDRIGSVVTLVDHLGTVLEHRSYDPFGKPRRGDFIDANGTIQSAIAQDPHPPYSLDPMTDRGFTDHEHLDEQRVIHMNGRIYDYNIGRFMSVDPFIQAPTSTQSSNPYSYIMNNPLSGTDPSGYIWGGPYSSGGMADEPEEWFKPSCLGHFCNEKPVFGADGNGSSPGGGEEHGPASANVTKVPLNQMILLRAGLRSQAAWRTAVVIAARPKTDSAKRPWTYLKLQGKGLPMMPTIVIKFGARTMTQLMPLKSLQQ